MTDRLVEQKAHGFKEDIESSFTSFSKSTTKGPSGSAIYSKRLKKDQEEIITKVAIAVIEVSKRESKKDTKLVIIKQIISDLFLPCLQMIEELEAKLVREKKTIESAPHQTDTQRALDSKTVVASLEDRVQELNKTNCYLETTLLACQSELESVKTRVKDFDRLKAQEEHFTSSLPLISGVKAGL